jgi:hypothetical protein
MVTNQEAELRRYTSHIKKYEKYPIVRNVLTEDTTFEKQVEEFYDLDTIVKATRVGPISEFRFRDNNSEKSGKTPKDLIEVLNEFSEKRPLDISKLSYNSVRNDYLLQERFRKKTMLARTMITVGGIALTGEGILLSLMGNPYLGTPLAISSWWGLVWGLINWPTPKDSNKEFDEYLKLIKSTWNADSFVKKHYRNYFIKKCLEMSL